MKRINIYLLCLLFAVVSCKKDNEDVSVETAIPYEVIVYGRLSEYVNDDNIYKITKLTMHDSVYCDDWDVLRDMAYSGNLETLVMTNAIIVGNDGQEWCNDKEIPPFVFQSSRNLKEVYLPNQLQVIGEESFASCRNLKTVHFPQFIDSIGPRAFHNSGLSGVFSVPNIRIIAKQAFARTNLEKVVIGSDILAGKSNTVYVVGGNSVFAECKKLTEVVVSEGCTMLELGFQGCSALRIVSLPSTLLTIGHTSDKTHNYIFCRCSSLKNVTLPDNLWFIGYDAFSHTAITNIVIPNNVKYLWDFAFHSCSSLHSVSLSNQLMKINHGCFADCTSLHTILIPNNVTHIDYRVFAGCTSLENVILGNSLVEIGRYAFYGCTQLKSINLPSTVTTLGESAFEGCSTMQSVTLSNNLESIKSLTFKDCVNLQNVTIGMSITSIGSSAFFHCPKITALQLPSTVNSIGEYALAYTGLQNLIVSWAMPPSVPSNTFNGTNINLATLKVPMGTIGIYQETPVWNDFGQIVEY